MEINIDTSVMQQMANGSIRATSFMADAMKSADTVTIHDDWNCSERDLINESILKVKKNNSIINENMQSFSAQVNDIASKFEELDRSLLNSFSSFDSSIGDMYKIENSVVTSNAQTKMTAEDYSGILTSRPDSNSYWDQYHASNLTNPISVLSFSDASDILQGTENNIKNETELVNELAGELGLADYISGDNL